MSSHITNIESNSIKDERGIVVREFHQNLLYDVIAMAIDA
jgi:hypothetical protein